MRTAENPMIGLDNVVIAKLLNDDVGGVVYDTPIALKGGVQASVNPNSSVETDYADNGAFFVADNRSNTEINLELTNVDPAVQALMLGQKRENGITVEGNQDQAPYFALGFRVWIGGTDENGEKIYELFWYAKGKFSVPESGGSTKQESISFQHKTLVAQFVSTIWQPEGKGGVFCTHLRTDYDADPATVASWFDAPVLNTDVDKSAVTVAIAKSGTKINVTGTKANSGTMKFALATVRYGDNITVTKAGALVEGSIGLNADGSALVFTPSASLSGEVVVTVTSGVKDVNGVGVTPTSASITM
ncbi:MAG: hypothetical protein MJ179_02620 [Treponema sp.]|nr:hypothetical protein [Treponema sp.]